MKRKQQEQHATEQGGEDGQPGLGALAELEIEKGKTTENLPAAVDTTAVLSRAQQKARRDDQLPLVSIIIPIYNAQRYPNFFKSFLRLQGKTSYFFVFTSLIFIIL